VRTGLRVLWAAFLVASAAEFAFFALVDPHDVAVLGHPVEAGRMAVYTAGFFVFWVVGAASAALAFFLAREPA
jgi:hypothetical protein